jgi:hypothetical protein
LLRHSRSARAAKSSAMFLIASIYLTSLPLESSILQPSSLVNNSTRVRQSNNRTVPRQEE